MHVKSATAWKKRWKDSHSRIPAALKEGAEEAKDVKAKILAGHDNWEERMADADVLARHKEKLEAMPEGKWKDGMLKKGVKRVREGLEAGTPDYEKAVDTARSTLEGIDLPPRTADMDANIDARVKPIGHALKKAFGKE